MLCVEKIPCHEDVPRLQFLVSSPQRFSYSNLNRGLTNDKYQLKGKTNCNGLGIETTFFSCYQDEKAGYKT